MKPLWLVTFLLCLLGYVHPTTAQEANSGTNEEIIVKVQPEPEGDIFVGQTVRIWVEFASEKQFVSPPVFPELTLSGAISLLPEKLGINLSRREDGRRLVGQRQKYIVIPAQAGPLRIPGIPLVILLPSAGGGTTRTEISTPPLTLNVLFPAEAKDIGQVVSVEKLSAQETYDRSLENVKVGDAVRRIITLKAKDTFALALPPVVFDEVANTRVYRAQPSFDDRVNRGQYSATRRDSATYVFEAAGDIILPEILVRWWNPVRNKVETLTLPEVEFSVAAGLATDVAPVLAEDGENIGERLKRPVTIFLIWMRGNISSISVLAMGGFLIYLVWKKFGVRTIAFCRQLRERHRSSERYAFAKFTNACRAGNDREMLRSFWNWADRVSDESEAVEISRLASKVPEVGFIATASELSSTRYQSPYRKWDDPKAILRKVAEFRRALLSLKDHPETVSLYRLNPRATKPY